MRSNLRPRATTLIETLVACFLVFLVLSFLASLVRRYRQVELAVNDHDRGMELRQSLQELARECSGATSVSLPASGSTSTQLIFTRIDPTLSTRLPVQRGAHPSPRPASWDPLDPVWLQSVTIEVVDQVLFRKVTFSDGQSSEMVLARPVLAFEAERRGPLLHLRVSRLVVQGSQSYATTVTLP